MKPSRHLAIRLLAAVARGIASAMLGSTSAAADDGPDLAASTGTYARRWTRGTSPLALGIEHGDRIMYAGLC